MSSLDETPGDVPGELRFWWIPQIPMKAFTRKVATIAEGRMLEEAFADYDQFQLDNNIKPDYSNTGGIARWEPDPDSGGFAWYDVDEEETDPPVVEAKAPRAWPPRMGHNEMNPRGYT